MEGRKLYILVLGDSAEVGRVVDDREIASDYTKRL